MKFLTYIGLLCGASAISLTQHHPVPVAEQFVLADKLKDIELTDEQKAEIQAWTEAELADGGTITKKEAWDSLIAFLDKHGYDRPDEKET